MLTPGTAACQSQPVVCSTCCPAPPDRTFCLPRPLLQPVDRVVFNDEAERKRELAAERARLQQERMQQVCWGRGCARGGGGGSELWGGAGLQATALGQRLGNVLLALLFRAGLSLATHAPTSPPFLRPFAAHKPPPPTHPPTLQAYDELKTTNKAKDMREQELLRAQMMLAYRTGDTKKAEQIKMRLEPDDPMAPKAQGVRAPAAGT